MKASSPITLLLLTLSSCAIFQKDASWHLEKARKMDPSLFETKVDTVVVEAGQIEFDYDSLALSLEDDKPFTLFVDTDVVESDGTVRKDSIRIEVKWKTKWKKESMTPEESLKILNKMLTPEDSARIHQRLLDVKIDCPDCLEEVQTIVIEPSKWDIAKFILIGIGVGLVLSFALKLSNRRN